MTTLAAPYDLLGPLPSGTTLLEASAGTGKTYTIAALVTRYVAEDMAPLSDLLVVTFGRAATRELRERVRERLTGARDALADPDRAAASGDALLAHLAAGDPAEVAARRERLVAATADFDAATITTTHGFCQLVIRGLGTAADADPDTDLLEDLTDLRAEVATDLYLRKYAPHDATAPAFTFDIARTIAAEATLDAHARIAPADADGAPRDRARYAEAVRAELRRRLRERRAMSFDDLLVVLRDALHGSDAEAVRNRLRSRYRVVLVDEFQDTDPVQWQILEAAFHGHSTLVLIGDPKQAIYAFRGGDVQTYLRAAELAGASATLPSNYRSDARVLAGLEALFGGAPLGDERIRVEPVTAGKPEPLLTRPAGPAASVRVRVHPGTGVPRTRAGLAKADPLRDAVAADVVRDIVTVLTDGSTLIDGGQERPVHPGDIAVLVRRNADGERMRDLLVRAGVPTVLRASTSVFGTAAATDWLVLLEALEQPHRIGRVRRLAVTDFVGRTASTVDRGGEKAHDALAQQAREWEQVLADRGPAALLGAVDADHATFARLLREAGGERRATDLRHIGDVLHHAATTERLGLAALLTWLRRRIREAHRDPGAERSRRLDSDAQAVQVVSIHMSKGLEFPLVYVPFAWARFVGEDAEVALYHGPDGTRIRDVGGPAGPDWATALQRSLEEDAGEELRLLYVAATRARSQLTLWWGRSTITRQAPLHRLLFTPPGQAADQRVDVPDLDEALARLEQRAAGSGGALGIETVALPLPETSWTAPTVPVGDPAAQSFTRSLDTAWRRTSYSALTALTHQAGPAPVSEPEAPGTADEPAEGEPAPLTDGTAPDATSGAWLALSPFGDLPAGAAFGSLVHAVLEEVDPAGDDLAAALRPAVERAARHVPVAGVDPEALVAALDVAMRTPLGPLADDRTLADFARADRLPELEFELPLAGGDRPGRDVRLGEVGDLLGRHLAPDDPVHPYADRLRGPELAGQPLRGYLTGSIDAVLRAPGPRYLVVDYKTNRLHPAGVPGTAWHYRPEALAPAMRASDYPLQALLYTVALHRYLMWRQPGYDPGVHLGGVLYLYLRGMCGPGTGGPDGTPGVFAWAPPTDLVLALSDLLAGGAP
jgi:exodeoxyribonuclease V beta subunit